MATNEEVDPRSRDHPRQCCSAGSVAATVPHGSSHSSGGYAPIDLQSSSRRSLPSSGRPRVDRYASKILYSFRALIISLKLSVIMKRVLRIHQDAVSMKRRRKMSSVSSHAEVMKRQNNYATSAVLHIYISFFREGGDIVQVQEQI